jgi:hypothetical protein
MTNPNLEGGGGDAAAATDKTAAAATAATAATGTDKATTVMDATSTADATGKTVPQDWSDDWRDKMTGGDKELAKQLETFKSPADLYKSYRAIQQKMTSGELKKAAELPKDATPEQVAAYRKEIGVPEKPEAYSLELDDGLIIGEEDKGIVSEILKDAHAANVPDKYVKPLLNSYFKKLEGERAAQKEFDAETWAKTEDAARAEWGGDFRKYQSAISNYMKTLPEEFQANLAGARLADGRKFLGTPEGLKFVLALAQEQNPVITTVGSSDNPAKTIADEKKALGIGTDEYWRDPAKQKRAAELIEAEEKLNKRRA